MLNSLKLIQNYYEHKEIPNNEKWLQHLANATEANVNFERLKSLEDLTPNYVLSYTEHTLNLLNELEGLSDSHKRILEEVLKWSEVAKCGDTLTRKTWLERNFNLFAHNIGSSQIFRHQFQDVFYLGENVEIVSVLIETHGLIGQFLKGEVPLTENTPLYSLVTRGFVREEELEKILYALNYCIISGVSSELWNELEGKVTDTICSIVKGDFKEETIHDRLLKLRNQAVKDGENFKKDYFQYMNTIPHLKETIEKLTDKTFWYVEASLASFSLEDFLKTFVLISSSPSIERVKHIDFSNLMKNIHYNFKGNKQINIYKKRIIENFLSQFPLSELIHLTPENTCTNHLTFSNKCDESLGNIYADFEFSLPSSKLIEFCEAAEGTDSLYDKSIILLFDLFGLRRDEFDRLKNEDDYLDTMNQNVDDKRKILDYVTGDTVLDIGPGGGVLLDLLEEEFPEKEIKGIDIATNVIQELERKKNREERKWEVVKGDAFALSEHFEAGSVDTIIFSSVLHELFSFVPFEGKQFNPATVINALKSAYAILPENGRIIVRDGIMTEPVEQNKVITFNEISDMDIFKRYVSDFKGRPIEYQFLDERSVLLPVNDAMEFLYTYTWGEESYHHEVKEQFGYLTPSGFYKVIEEHLEGARVVFSKSYLQAGYEENLLKKIIFKNEDLTLSPLPDSTFFVVVEKN